MMEIPMTRTATQPGFGQPVHDALQAGSSVHADASDRIAGLHEEDVINPDMNAHR
jgi:hypothetical protein